MMPSWAKPGAKVVCVDATESPLFAGHAPLERGKIYEIECVYPPSYTDPEYGVSVVGVTSKSLVGFRLSRFRPVVEQKDDIALFTHLLNTTSEDQLVREEA